MYVRINSNFTFLLINIRLDMIYNCRSLKARAGGRFISHSTVHRGAGGSILERPFITYDEGEMENNKKKVSSA